MTRRAFSREFKQEAFDLVTQRGVSTAQASRDLGIHATVLRRWVRALSASDSVPAANDLQLALPFTERRRGVEIKLVFEGTTSIDEPLIPNVANANHWYKPIKEGATFDQVAAETGTSKRRIQQMVHLAFLAPDIVRQITRGKQPLGLTSDWLLRHSLPVDWEEQRQRVANL